jgi:hypothetical protein
MSSLYLYALCPVSSSDLSISFVFFSLSSHIVSIFFSVVFFIADMEDIERKVDMADIAD